MSSKERIGIILDVDAEVSKAKGNISSLSKIFDGVGGSKGNQLRDLLSDISAEYEKLANESGKTMSKVGDFTKAEKSSERLSQLLRRLEKEIGNIGKSSKGDLSKFFPPEVADRVKKASDAVKTYNTILENSSKKKGAIGAAADEYEKQEKAARKAAEALKDLQDIQQGKSQKQAVTSDVKVKKQESLTAANAEVRQYSKELQEAQKAMDEFKVRKAELFTKGTQNKSSEFRELRDNLAAAETNFKGATDRAAELRRELKNMVVVGDLDAQIEAAEQSLKEAQAAAEQLKTKLDNVTATEFSRAFDEAKKKLEGMSGIDLSEIINIDDLNNLLQRFTNEGIQGLEDGLRKAGVEIRDLGNANTEVEGKVRSNTAEIERQNRALEDVNGIKNRILQFFSLTNAMQLGRQAIRQTIETVKELDKSMTETAVVTDFSVGDMWDQLPEYTDMARQYGVAIKGVYDASTLYYQQGLNQEQTMQLTGETLKMARIAGLDYADATDLMTAALRGFNMELNETNATRINDVYSELAAITAADTEEIATAMTKTASIASSANMEFETTAALLSQIIETTREPAETAGTAMKTIIARFTEMKKATSDLINIDGEEVSVNKVEDALKSAGVALRDVNGEFRDLDDVFLELSSKWDSLDIMTQRYIATMAAGSRQQSRFIAMMQNYDRTMELVDAAYNSGGASALQFGKTQESLETKLNNLKSAWQEFLMGLANSDAIKNIIDVLTKLINVLNDATTGVGGFSTFALRMFSIIATFKIGKGFFNKIFSNIDMEMFKGGQKAGRQVGLGLQKGVDDSVKQANKGIVSSLRSKIVNVFTNTKMIPKIPIDFDWDSSGNINASKFAQTIANSLTPAKIIGQIDNIGATLENSINAQLEAHGLYDEGADWVKTLINGFKENMRKEGANLQTEVANVVAGVRAELNTPVDSSDPDAEQKQQKKQMALNDFDKNGGVVINKEAIPVTKQVQANVAAIGSALSAASMAANLLTSGFVDLGILTEDGAKGIENIGSGLAAAGTAMMFLKTAADAFKVSCLTNPVIIGIAAVVAGISIIGGIFKQMAEDAKQANEELINAATEYQEEVNNTKEQVDAYNELLDTYKKTGEGAEDLQKRKEELIDVLDLEKYGVDALTSSYDEVAEAAKKAREEMLQTNKAKQTAGLQGATSQAVNEGSKPGWGGAGWTDGGSSFEIDIGGTDSYTDLVNIFKTVAEDKGISGLSYSQNGSGNLQINGLDNSEEGRRLWMEAMSQVLSDYGSFLSEQGKDSGDAWGYVAMSEYWGKVSGYYEDANNSLSNLEATEKEQAQDNALIAAKEQDKISDMTDFSTAVKNIVDSLSDYKHLTEEQKKSIAISALQLEDSDLEKYGQTFTQLLKLSGQEGFESFLENIDGTHIDLIVNADVVIDKEDTIEEVEYQLAQASVKDAIFGDIDLGQDLLGYVEKINNGELTEEDKKSVGTRLQNVEGVFEGKSAKQYWESVQDLDRGSQIEALRKISAQTTETASKNREAALSALPDIIFVSPDAEAAIGDYNTYKAAKANYDFSHRALESGGLLNSSITKENMSDYEEAYVLVRDWKNVEKKEDKFGISKGSAMDIITKSTGQPWDLIIYGASAFGEKVSEAIDSSIVTDKEKAIETYNNNVDEANKQENITKHNEYKKVLDYYDTNKDGVLSDAEKQNYYTDQSNISIYETQYSDYDSSGVKLNADGTVDLSATAELYGAGFTNETLESLKLYSANLNRNLTEEEYGKLSTEEKYNLLDKNVTEYRGYLGYQGLSNYKTADSRTFDQYSDAVIEKYGDQATYKDIIAQSDGKEFSNTDVQQYIQYLDEAGKIDLSKPWKEVSEQIKALDKDSFELDLENDEALDSVDEVNDRLEVLDETMSEIDEIKIAIDTAQLEAALTQMRLIQAEADNMSNATSLIDAESFQVGVDEFRQIIGMYPELLEGAYATQNGLIQLDKEHVQTVINGKKQVLQAELDKRKAEAEITKQNLKEQITIAEKIRDGEISAKEASATAQLIIRNSAAQDEAEIDEKSANEGINASNSRSEAVIGNINQEAAAFNQLGIQLNSLNAALRGGTYDPSTYAGNIEFLPSDKYTSTTEWDSTDDFLDDRKTDSVQSSLSNYKNREKEDENLSIEEFLQKGGELTDNELAAIQLYNAANQFIEDSQYQIDHMDEEFIITQAMINDIGVGSGTGGSGGSGSGSKGSQAENETNATVKNIDQKLSELDRQLENNQIDAVEYKRQRDELLGGKGLALSNQLLAEQEAAKYYGEYYYYDNEAQAYLYNTEAYDTLSDETKNEVDKEISKLNEINSEVKKIRDEMTDYEFRFQGNEQKYYDSYYGSQNDDSYLANLDRKRGYLDRERELVGKLPEEIQGPLNMALLGQDMAYEAQEIQYNRSKLAETQNMRKIYEQEAHFFGTGEDDYFYYDEATDSYMWYQDRMANEFLDEDTRKAIEDEYNKLNEKLQEENRLEDELYGGVIQDAFRGMAKASKTVSKSLKEQDKATDHLNDAFNDLEKKLGLSEDALDGFADKIGGAIQESEFLKKEVKGFGIKDAEEKVNNSAIAGLLSDDQKTALTQILGDGGTIGDITGSLFGGGSDFLNSIGDFLNFDMMSLGLDMFNGMKGMIDQGKQMVEKIIGYITQATQVIVDAWTNREDYLYNFLKIIEKHLQEYEKLQRYSTQLEKGRLTSSQDILNNWNDQWKSLQLQLEEQQERLETRQKELERSRWNPFSLISGWNPSSDTLYENREVKFLWDLLIGFGQMAPMGLGAFFSQLNQLYEDYDQRVQNSYEDRLAAEQAILDIEDERLELVKVGSEEATEFEQKLLDAMIQKEQEQIDELTRLNDAITDANSKLISTLQDNLDKMRQDRENEKKEEELGEKERRLAYLRQDTSGANMLEIKKLEEQLEEEHEDYTDTLIDQKISELEKQNELAAEQRQQQIDLLQSQLDYAEKYGLYWDAIYGMLYTIDENGNAVLNPENFDLDGNIRENSQLAQMLGTFSDRLGMSVWSAVLDNEEVKRLGRYYGAFIGMNGVDGNWANYWALQDPGADDPNYAYPDQEIPDGLWGVLYKLEIGIKKYFANSDPDLIDRGGRIGQAFKNFFGKLFGNEEWANYQYEAVNAAHVQSTTFAGMKKLSDDTKEWFKSLFSNNESYGNKTSRNLTGNGAQNIGDINTTNYFQIGNVGETISLDEMVDRVAERFKDMFSIGNNVLGRSRT